MMARPLMYAATAALLVVAVVVAVNQIRDEIKGRGVNHEVD